MIRSKNQSDSCILRMGRQAGVGLHFTSLPGPYGIGDIADSAMAFIDQLVGMKLGVWQFLPLGPTAYGDSPYQPLSPFAGNANLIGLDVIISLHIRSQKVNPRVAGGMNRHFGRQFGIPAPQFDILFAPGKHVRHVLHSHG